MKRPGFALALLASAAMVIAPVAPSIAQSASSAAAPQARRELDAVRVMEKVARGEAQILSREQMDEFATTRPELHAKLAAAAQAGTLPKLTEEEKKLVSAKTSENLAEFRAGMGLPSPGQCREGLVISTIVFVGGCLFAIATKTNPWGAVIGGVGMMAYGLAGKYQADQRARDRANAVNALSRNADARTALEAQKADLLAKLQTLRDQLALTATQEEIQKVDAMIANTLANDATLGQIIADIDAGK